jgi:hypothetical protein
MRFAVTMAEVFPAGCALMPDSITEAEDFDPATGRRSPARDKVTNQRVYQCKVADLDPELAGRSREVSVKILADVQPVPPTGAPFEPVEFSGITITPWVNDKNRLAFSIRATGISAPSRGGRAGGSASSEKTAA